MNIKQRIKEVRVARGMTQKKLAEELDVTTTTIQNYENGRREPNFEMLGRISKVLDVPISNLMQTKENSFSIEIISAISKAYCNNHNGHPASDIFKILSDDLDLDIGLFNIFKPRLLTTIVAPNGTQNFDEIVNKDFDSSKELSIDIRIRLLDYLSGVDYQTFLDFCKTNEESIYIEEIKNKITKIMASKVFETKFKCTLSFKKYLSDEFGNKFNNFNDDDLIEIEESTKKFLEFTLYKLEKDRNKEEYTPVQKTNEDI